MKNETKLNSVQQTQDFNDTNNKYLGIKKEANKNGLEAKNNSYNQNVETDLQNIGLSIMRTSSQKTPLGTWKQYQSEIAPENTWIDHYRKGGYVGVITGKISGNLEVIDIDSKHDIGDSKIYDEYKKIIPQELLDKLLIQTTPNKGYHFIYRCLDCTITGNEKLAWNENDEVLIETRGEGGYFCHHLNDYKITQGKFDLLNGDIEIPIITKQERALLLTLARSLTKSFAKSKNGKDSKFEYKEPAINKFNDEYNIIELFQKHGWSVYKDQDDKIMLTRPDSSAPYSGYYYKDTKTFMCFSTSTSFDVQRPYNHFQTLQELEGTKDYRKALSRLDELGYKTKSKPEKVSFDDIADFLNDNGVRYDSFRQDLIFNGGIITEMVYNTLYIDMQKHFEKSITKQKFEDVIKSNYIKKYNPIEEFITKHSDRQPAGLFEKWMNCFDLKNKSIDKSSILHFLKKWYVGIIAQALGGEYPNEFFLTLLSTEQGIGKTTLLRNYTLPKELQDYRVEHSLSFDDDFKVIMGQSLLIIDDEMDGRTYEAEKTFKTILSTKEITTRRKYDRRISYIKRRCSFAGSGNNLDVIRETKNRRIIPIEIEKIYFDRLKEIDLVDLFMEAYYFYSTGFHYSYHSTDAPLLDEVYQDYIQLSDVDLVLDEHVKRPICNDDETYISVLELVNRLSIKYPNFQKRINVPSIGKKMAERGFQKKRIGEKKITSYAISSRSLIKSFDDDIEGIRYH